MMKKFWNSGHLKIADRRETTVTGSQQANNNLGCVLAEDRIKLCRSHCSPPENHPRAVKKTRSEPDVRLMQRQTNGNPGDAGQKLQRVQMSTLERRNRVLDVISEGEEDLEASLKEPRSAGKKLAGRPPGDESRSDARLKELWIVKNWLSATAGGQPSTSEEDERSGGLLSDRNATNRRGRPSRNYADRTWSGGDTTMSRSRLLAQLETDARCREEDLCRHHDCPYNVWLYRGGHEPGRAEVQEWQLRVGGLGEYMIPRAALPSSRNISTR